MSSTKSSAGCAAVSIRGGKGEGLDARGPGFLPGQSAEPVPDRLLRPDAHSELDDFQDCHVGPGAPPPSSPSFSPPPPSRPACSNCSGICAASLLIPFSLPSLPHPLHLKTFSHQDSTNEGPFALAHPVQIQGYPEFPAHALISWLCGRERETKGCFRCSGRDGVGEGGRARHA